MTYEERVALSVPQTRAGEADEPVTVLVRRHAAFVYQVAYSILRDSHDAEDVTQETFIRVMKNADRLPTIRDQRAWLARVAWRLALTRWNRTRRRRTMEVSMPEEFDYPDVLEVSSESAVQSQELIEVMERLTSSLPEELRHTLALSAIESLSAREVAGIMNISETTVRTRVHRAKKLLREKIQNVLGGKHG